MADIYERMPVILKPEEEKVWLGQTGSEKLQSLLIPYTGNEMELYPISTDVNRPSNDTASILERI